MKDPWLLQQRRASQRAIDVDALVRQDEPEQVWRQCARTPEEWVVALKNGNALVMGTGEDSLTVYGPRFKKARQLHGANLPTNAEICYPLFDGVFASIDNQMEEGSQVLRTHDSVSGRDGSSRLCFDRYKYISGMAAVTVGEREALLVLGDHNGNLTLMRYLDGELTRINRSTNVHKDSIFDVVSHGNRFGVTSVDGLVTLWDVKKEKIIGSIKNPQCVDLHMDAHHVYTTVDCVMRVYENKPGMTLKWVVRLPIFGPIFLYLAFKPLTKSVGFLHDENYGITFFDMVSGTPIYRLKSPFKAITSFAVLGDASLFLTSMQAEEGHAILSITKSERAYSALCEYASNNFSPARAGKALVSGERNWTKWACIASAVVGGVNIAKRLAMK